MQLGDCVDFVMWSDVRLRKGRRVQLDGHRRIKAMVWSMTPENDYSEARVLIVDTQAEYRHYRMPELRGQLAARCMTLQMWYSCKAFPGPLPLADRKRCTCVILFLQLHFFTLKKNLDAYFNCLVVILFNYTYIIMFLLFFYFYTFKF